jgi:hypothetical protein
MANRKPNASYTFKQNVQLFNYAIKFIKSELPSNCTFLSLIKKPDGEIMIKASIKNRATNIKDSFLYTVPQDFSLTDSDLARIKELISNKCVEYGS